MLVQLSMFAAQTAYHRIDHRNLELRQRTAARRRPSRNLRMSRNLRSIHVECLQSFMEEQCRCHKIAGQNSGIASEAVLLLRIDGEMRVAASARTSPKYALTEQH